MLSGPNLEALAALGDLSGAQIIASGGISSLQDVRSVKELASSGSNVDGVIIGKALYEERFQLAEALAVVAED